MATLVEAYLERLGLPAACLADGPTLPLLETLVEAHLATLPFSNLSQHLAGGDAAPSLSPSRLQEKLLARRHGGNCFELNGLFALLLRDIGLETLLLQCRVWTGRERGNRGKPGYRRHPTHLLLLVGGVQGAVKPRRRRDAAVAEMSRDVAETRAATGLSAGPAHGCDACAWRRLKPWTRRAQARATRASSSTSALASRRWGRCATRSGRGASR